VPYMRLILALMGIWSACSDTVESLICIYILYIYRSLEFYLCQLCVYLFVAC
jgi:hypothetical protein